MSDGGSPDRPFEAKSDHAELAAWAASCAERVLGLFEARSPDDQRPRAAIDAARSWLAGSLSVPEARALASAAHVAAREAGDLAAVAAARAAGHAAATAHVETHARHAAGYALRAIVLSHGDVDAERLWQRDRLAEHLRSRHLPRT